MSRWTCPGCGYVYDEESGDPHEGFAPGTSFAEIPDEWFCPDCGVRDKVDFEAEEEAEAMATSGSASAPARGA